MAHNRYSLHQLNTHPVQGRLMYLSTSVYENDWDSIVHSHPIAELFYVVNGAGLFMIDNIHQPVKQHDLLIVNPNTLHTEKAIPSQPMEYVALGIDELTLNNGYGTYFLGNFADYHNQLLKYFSLMIEESQLGQYGSDAICQHLLASLLLLLQRKSGQFLAAGQSNRSRPQPVSPECGRVKDYIDSYYSEHITLADLAQIAGWDRFHLSHTFTKIYGTSPMNYLQDKRLYYAKELLKTSDYTIAEIAQMLAFSSQNYFTQVFKRKVGITATEYRRAHTSVK